MKFCFKCKTHKEFQHFSKNKSRKDGYADQCKICDYEYVKSYRNTAKGKESNRNSYNSWRKQNLEKKAYKEALRRATNLEATPKWSDLSKIKEIYKNCPIGYHVDHIIPLKGKNVSGLHVDYNLQYLPANENLKKSNKV